MQFSHGYLKSPEQLSPEENVHRTTASVIYNRALGTNRNFQTTFVWGRNTISDQSLDSYLLEAELKHDGGWSPYMRYEHITKDAHELVLSPTFPENQEFNLQQATIGVVRDIFRQGDFMWGLGAQTMLNFTPNALEPVYGNDPTGWLIYLRVQPRRMGN